MTNFKTETSIRTKDLKIGVQCGKHGPQVPVFCCDHWIQDPVHPVGIVKFPFSNPGVPPGTEFFLCVTCFRTHAINLLGLANIMRGVCRKCVEEEIARICAVDPGLFLDASKSAWSGEGSLDR